PTPLLIGRFTHLTCNSTRFDIASAGLVTVDVPPTPTPEPPLIFPAAPKTGRSVSWCEGASPWQICQMALQDSQFQPAQPITGALPFRGNVSAISWSPDGRRLTFSAGQVPNEAQYLFVINGDGTDLKQISSEAGFGPIWSPDGGWIAFIRGRGLWRMRPDGTETQVVVPDSDYGVASAAWSPDSQRLAYLAFRDGLARRLSVVNLDRTNLIVVYAFADSAQFDGGAVFWSADGRYLVAGLVPRRSTTPQILVLDAATRVEAARLKDVPYWWQVNFWPPWGGAVQ
ncbi:MAG: PD40 domain-containing protein, partial [Anaerolineales bacterium]|nr:PD40 domain-containing protein [Anaerolineales bacterium]